MIHKITKKQVTIADPGAGIVKLIPEEFFGEVQEEGKSPKYQWSGVLILLVKNDTFMKGAETKGLLSRAIQSFIVDNIILFCQSLPFQKRGKILVFPVFHAINHVG